MIPRMVPGTGSAYLGVAHKPFETQADPAQPGPFKLPNFSLAAGLSVDRLSSRRDLLTDLDKLRAQVDASGRMEGTDKFGHKAWELLCSPAAQTAFDLDSEPQAIRERYGFMPAFDPGAADRCGAPAWSQRMLLARRLVEAGVRLVTVDLRWWDTHVLGFDSLRRGFLPRWDQAYSALVEDLTERGLMERTLVVAWGEFGRTPRVNNNAGRDHYPNVFSAALCGGKVKGAAWWARPTAKARFPRTAPRRRTTCSRRSTTTSASTSPNNTSTKPAAPSARSPSANRSASCSSRAVVAIEWAPPTKLRVSANGEETGGHSPPYRLPLVCSTPSNSR
jgi:hypothetical protein